MKITPKVSYIPQKSAAYLKNLSKEQLAAAFPLEKLDMGILEGIQKDIPVLQNTSMSEIKFLTKHFHILNIGRNCTTECAHCLRNAQLPDGNSAILWDDLVNLTSGVEKLNEKLGFNVLQGNDFLMLHNDFNPPEFISKDLSGNSHNFADAVKLVFGKLGLPIETLTAGWNRADKHSERAAVELVEYLRKNPQANDLVSISVNPFHGILEKSRQSAKTGNPEQARFWREVYTDRISHAIETFFPIFKEGNASLIYRSAGSAAAPSEVGAKETASLYQEIYAKLQKALGRELDSVDNLRPEYYENNLPERFIEAKGKGRKYFSQEENLKKQQALVTEKLEWETASPEQRVKDAYDYAIKEIDINGDVYAGTLSESYIKTGIKLDYINKKDTAPMFSDVKLSELTKSDIINYSA